MDDGSSPSKLPIMFQPVVDLKKKGTNLKQTEKLELEQLSA